MPLTLERLDHLERVDADGPVGAAVMAPVALPVSFHAIARQACLRNRELRHPAARDADLYHRTLSATLTPHRRSRSRARCGRSGPECRHCACRTLVRAAPG